MGGPGGGGGGSINKEWWGPQSMEKISATTVVVRSESRQVSELQIEGKAGGILGLDCEKKRI